MSFLSPRSARRRTHRTASLTSVSRQVIKQIILKAISKHTKDKKVTGVVSIDLWREKHA